MPPQKKLTTSVIMRHSILCLVFLLFGTGKLVLAARTGWPNVNDSPLLHSRGLAVETEQQAQYCNEISSCPEKFFCDFSDKQQSAGVCRDCAIWSPLECSAYLTTTEGQASCISTCFEPCLVDQLFTDPCPSSSSGEAHFCTFIDDDTNPNGSCMNCNSHLIKSPIDCRYDLVPLPFPGKQSCASECFAPCNETLPCPANSFCTFDDIITGPSGVATGVCMECESISSDLIQKPENCMDNTLFPSLGMQSCLSSCFEPCQSVISIFEADSLCADGFFCADKSPYCQDCKTVMETTTPLHCSQSKLYNDNAFCNERPSFQPCSDNDPCSEDGFFCTYELGTTGFCQQCESWGNIQTPLDCTNNDRLIQLLNPAGQESCVTSCFQHCDEQTPCQTDGSFCTFHDKGSTRGVCQDCNTGHLQAPLDCKMFSADGREGCVDACFQPCSPIIDNIPPCRPGSFCTNLDMDVDTSGACMSCNGLTPLDCSDPEKIAYGEDSCASECFAMSPCSESSPCPTGFFCTYQSDISTTSDESVWLSSSANGYCLGCDRFIDPIACFFGDFPVTFKESCASTCFDECSAEFRCEDGSFCNYEFKTSGFCSSCEWFTNHLECGEDTDIPFYGISSCKNTCFGCDMNNPCPDGRYCNFVDVDLFGYCDACPTFDPQQCADGDNSFAVDSCTSNCFDACSETSNCPIDGYFCDFQSGDTGVCMDCNGSRINTPLDCKNLNLNSSGEESCATTCFDICDEANPCKNDGEFCTFQLDTTGSCMDCNISSVQDPLDCNELNLNPSGEASCATKCFDTCDTDNDCLEDNYFCTFQLGSSGSCMDCNHRQLNGNPFQCSDSTFLPEASKGSCLSNCFDECSLDNPCGDDDNFFCTSSVEGGYCMDCNAGVRGNPNGCLNLDLSFVDEEQCLSTCLVKCVTDEDCPVPDIGFIGEGCDGFCSAQCINGAPVFGGYCTSQCQAWCGPAFQIPCKFCPNLTPDIVEDIIGHNNTNQTDTPAIPPAQKGSMCNFCPNNDMKYPDRHMRMWVGAFGPEAKCSDLGSYFSTVPTNPNSRNCRLAQMMDHTCGCTGNGYGGADSTTKMVVLAWFPRCMAFLSFMGSTIIVFNIITKENKQRKTFNQFMILLSLFDMIGSVAYAFTTLPLPAEDYMYGSRGNAATCTAQGFFIQLGVIAAYMNVSLSFYYLLILKFGWSESRIEKLRSWLFGVPIAIGLTFAFAGIPYYDNMILWCNNTSNIWPDIPMAVAIIVATVNMGLISCHVYKEEKVSRKWRSGTQQNSLSTKVFRQSILYLLAFYLVWPPYLVLQYLWAAGSSFDKFGFILFAGVAVPLQGFWNCLAYTVPRMKKRKGVDFLGLRSAISRLSTKLSKSVGRKTSRESYKEDVGTTHKGIPPKDTVISSVGLKSSRESHLFEVSFNVEDSIFPVSENCPSPVIGETNVKGADGTEQIIENGTKEEL